MRQPEQRAAALQVAAEKNFPGRSLASLTDAEKELLFTDFNSQQDYYYSLLTSPTPGVKMMGNVAVANPWEALGNAAEKAIGGYALGKSRKREQDARGIAADLLTRSDAVSKDEEAQRLLEEEERRLRYLMTIMGRGQTQPIGGGR